MGTGAWGVRGAGGMWYRVGAGEGYTQPVGIGIARAQPMTTRPHIHAPGLRFRPQIHAPGLRFRVPDGDFRVPDGDFRVPDGDFMDISWNSVIFHGYFMEFSHISWNLVIIQRYS